jgi:hypothetical protein
MSEVLLQTDGLVRENAQFHATDYGRWVRSVLLLTTNEEVQLAYTRILL